MTTTETPYVAPPAYVETVAPAYRGSALASAVALYLGAFLVVFYILSITWAGPRIGIGNAVFFVLLGQLVAAAVIDHYGLWGAIQSELTLRRALGIVVMAIGVYLARKTT